MMKRPFTLILFLPVTVCELNSVTNQTLQTTNYFMSTNTFKQIFSCCIIAIAIIFPAALSAQQLQPIGMFDHHQDVGDPKLKGSAVYNEKDQSYEVSGAGKNMWAKEDQFHFLWKKIKGDFIIQASIEFVGKGTDDHRKIGIIARDNLTSKSRYADACVHGDILTSLQYRAQDTAVTEQVVLSSYHPTHIEFQRIGNTF